MYSATTNTRVIYTNYTKINKHVTYVLCHNKYKSMTQTITGKQVSNSNDTLFIHLTNKRKWEKYVQTLRLFSDVNASSRPQPQSYYFLLFFERQNKKCSNSIDTLTYNFFSFIEFLLGRQ